MVVPGGSYTGTDGEPVLSELNTRLVRKGTSVRHAATSTVRRSPSLAIAPLTYSFVLVLETPCLSVSPSAHLRS